MKTNFSEIVNGILDEILYESKNGKDSIELNYEISTLSSQLSATSLHSSLISKLKRIDGYELITFRIRQTEEVLYVDREYVESDTIYQINIELSKI